MRIKSILLVSTVLLSSPFTVATPLFQENDEMDTGDDFDYGLEDFYGGDDFVSIATGTAKSLSKAPSIATVISSNEIKKLGATNIHQVLETITGLHVYPSNFNRMNPSYSIRGIHTRQNPQVHVQINGRRVATNFAGTKPNLFNTNIDIIDRIEVIKGPGSAVHGADAFSGVINIITKGHLDAFKNDVGVRYGSFGSASAWLNWSNSLDAEGFSINAQWSKTDGDNSRIISQDGLHSLGLGFLSNAPGPLDTDIETIDLHLRYQSEAYSLSFQYLSNDGGTGSGAAQVLSNNDNTHTELFTFAADVDLLETENSSHELKLTYQEFREDNFFTIFPSGFALPRAFDPETGAPSAFTVFTDGVIGAPSGDEWNIDAELVSLYSVDKHQYRFSFGYIHNDFKAGELKNFGPLAQDFTEDFRDGTLTDVRGTPFIYAPDNNREIFFVSAQDEWAFAKDWELTAGIRYDHYSDFGSTVNPRVALVWQAKHNLTVKALYGRAFRAPSFEELYAENNPVTLGNSSLDPETINTVELGFDYRPSLSTKLLFTLFSYKADNLIVYTLQPDGTSQANNSVKQNGIGAELDFNWNVSNDIEFSMGYSWQDAEDDLTGDDIPDAPQNMLDATIEWEFLEDWNLHIDTRWILNRERLRRDPRAPIDDYNWTNAHLRYAPLSGLEIGLSIRNLFDEKAFEATDGQIPEDFPLEERGYWLTVSKSWN